MSIDIWGAESHLYALIDAHGMRGGCEYRETFDLGNNHYVDIKITNFSKNQLSNHSIVDISEFVISLNFRKIDCKDAWFRVDNESKDSKKEENYLHFHYELNGKKFCEHQPIIGRFTVAEIISMTFDKTYNIIKEKFPNDVICDGPGFCGFS